MNSLAIDFGEAADATNPPNSSSSSSLPAVMRRFALFVDGMTRAMILPFGPTLVHRLVYGQTEIRPATWSGVAYYLGWVVAVYILGGWLGNVMSQHLIMSKDRLPIVIARLGGAALSLQIFTYGAGLASVRGLAAIRFVSAILAGLLCGVTVSIPLPEDDWIYRHGEKSTSDEETADALRRREGYVDIASGTAKIYLTGFAVSILSGGLLFRKATKDATFQALTGAYQYTWSPLFLIGVAVTAEIILRGLFALARNPNATENEGSGTAGRVRGVVRRMVSDVSQTTGRDVIVAIESLTSAHRSHAMSQAEFRPLMEEDDDDDQSNFVLHTENQLYFDADVATHATPARSRVESYTSIDEFFDCRSALSDLEEGERSIWPPLVADENEVACYVNGKCVYSDGSRACVPQGECVARLPPNYLAFYNHNQHKARRAWEETQKWRLEKGVWKIHTMPNTWFNKVKEAYPHFVHGHSKAGYPVVYEQPGRMNLKDLFRNGCQVSDMIMHYTFFMEYLSNHVCTREEIRCVLNGAQPLTSSSWGMMVVMDVKGAGLSHLSGDVVKYLKQAGDINSAHYPISMKRAFLVNSPFWLAGAWSGLKGMLPDSVHVDILSESKYPNALREFIDEDQIPPEYGGTSLYGLGSHPYELELRKLVDDVKDDETDLLMNIPQGSVLVDNAKDYDLRRDLPMNLPRGIIVPSEVDRRRGDFSSDVVFTQEKLKSLLSPYAKKTPPPLHPIRRRVSSIDQALRRNIRGVDFQTPSKTGSLNGHRDVFFIVSAMHVLWSFVQGAIEVAIPLWILSPTTMGGLGYSPSRTGVSFFCACLVLLWTLRTKPSKLVSKIPSKSPLRAFRIGAGSEAALLAMLAFVSTSTS